MKSTITIFSVVILFLLYGCPSESNDIIENENPKYSSFSKLKITDIHPQGWIKEFLERQKTGLTGNIEVAGYPFDTKMWATEKIKGSTKAWWPYEQTAYYIDGVHRLGLLLNDDTLMQKAKTQTQYVLNHIDSTTGRVSTNLADRWWRWPYAQFFRNYMTEYEVTGDKQIIDALHKHYLTFTANDFADDLELANVEELCWLYGVTHDKKLLNMAEESYQLFKSDIKYRNRSEGENKNDMQFGSDRIPDMHGVVYLELVKIPAILYSYTGKLEYLAEAENGIQKMEKHHMLISGLPSSTEHFRGITDLAGHETCNTAVFPHTYGYMLRITGDASYGDRIEKAVFNAGIGSITKDFKSHQYFSAPNQIISSQTSNLYWHNPARMMYAPGHDVECCTGNINRFMPYYIEQMWMRTPNNGLAAALYGPSAVTTAVGENNIAVTIIEETNYPFSEEINFKIETKEKVLFPFYIRIPTWCSSPEIFINGTKTDMALKQGAFAIINREFKNEDIITLKIPAELIISSWPNNEVGVERGPLVFSLPIDKIQSIVDDYPRSSKDFPAYEMMPNQSWNFGVVDHKSDFTVEFHSVSGYPWDEGNSPITIKVPVEKVENWKMVKVYDGMLEEEVYKTPAIPKNPIFSGDLEYMSFVPYGSTTLRLSVFPKVEK